LKTRQIVLLFAAFALASPAAAEPCSSFPARIELAAALRRAAEDHPVNVAFDSRAEGVTLPDWLSAQYPDDMAIVLQHQFHRLKVLDSSFEVGLWFKGRYARLVIPFAAINGFWDDGAWKCGKT
jgi:hypothetical protein